jgi:hypothetical protein
MTRTHRFAALCLVCGLGAASAAPYPVTGKWAYDRGVDVQDACREGPTMEFRGDRRFDTGGSVPDYRNQTISKVDLTTFRMVDQFFNGLMRGKVNYTLHVVDDDHLELYLLPSRTTIKLLRCP